MSEIGLNINVDSYNNEGIKTIKGNNNAEIYKLYILKNKRRLSLVGKTVKLGYVMVGTTNGDVIENLNITNAEQGEITFPITNRISKQDGVYSCQLAIYGADGFLEHTATFGLTVEANIFTKIAGEIENSKDLTYIERILEEAKTVSGDLKTNIPVATNLNSSLESNISNARNINTTLADTTEKSKVAATDAIEKKSQLEKSITKAKEFINGLDGSQNIPQIRMDVTELQNGLKSNQALAYKGSSINAENTLEGRTEGMKVKGKTMYKKADGTYTDTWEEGVTLESFGEKEGNKISILSYSDNLYNTILEKGDIINNNGQITPSSGIARTKDYIFLPQSKKLYFKINFKPNTNWIAVFFYDKDKNFIKKEDTWVLSNVSFDVPTNAKYIKFKIDNVNSIYIEDIQITYNTNARYQSYKCDKKDILIKEPLRSKDDICDLLYEDNGQVKIDRYVGIRKYQEGDERNKDVLTDKINTVYILDKPVTEIVENCVDIDLDTFGEKTYFNILNSLPGTLDFKVPSNIASIVQNTAREVNNIWDVINNLLVPSLIDINKNVAMSTIKNNLK